MSLVARSESAVEQSRYSELVHSFLSGRNQSTIEAYAQDLETFRRHMGAPDIPELAAQFLTLNHGVANHQVLKFRSDMIERGLQPSTINRKLAALRSFVKLARTIGIVTWEIEIGNLKAESYRDTKGPGLVAFKRMLAVASEKPGRKSLRDRAILRLMFDLALRVSEVANLDIGDVGLEESRVAVLGKGRTQKQMLSMPTSSLDSIKEWIEVRGAEAGPLFLSMDRTSKSKSVRLTRTGLYQIVRTIGEKAGVKTRPHGLRHLSITEACKAAQNNGYGIEEVMDHSRHKSVATLMIYRDRERDVQGAISSLVSNTIMEQSHDE